jgi:hypothetical protein
MEKHRHTEACVWKVYPSGQQSCVTAKNEREKALRAAGKLPRTGFRFRDRRQPPDGWEDEFGPVPLRELNRDWYDEVIVQRALNLERTGRNPYPLEWKAIVARVNWDTVEKHKLAEAIGVSEWYLKDRRRTYSE